MPFGN